MGLLSFLKFKVKAIPQYCGCILGFLLCPEIQAATEILPLNLWPVLFKLLQVNQVFQIWEE